MVRDPRIVAMSNPADALPVPRPRPEATVDEALKTVEHQISLFWRRARSVSNQLSRQVHPDMEPAAYGLLSVIRREGPIRLTDLALNIGVGKPSVSRQIAFLESIGLVSKEADPLDGRAQAIRLTPRARRRCTRSRMPGGRFSGSGSANGRSEDLAGHWPNTWPSSTPYMNATVSRKDDDSEDPRA